jgi:hypothetical protein
MSQLQIAVLGAVAGLTIFLGLPIARIKAPARWLRELLNATATGVLLVLLRDVLSHTAEPVEESLVDAVGGMGGWATFALRAAGRRRRGGRMRRDRPDRVGGCYGAARAHIRLMSPWCRV